MNDTARQQIAILQKIAGSSTSLVYEERANERTNGRTDEASCREVHVQRGRSYVYERNFVLQRKIVAASPLGSVILPTFDASQRDPA